MLAGVGVCMYTYVVYMELNWMSRCYWIALLVHCSPAVLHSCSHGLLCSLWRLPSILWFIFKILSQVTRGQLPHLLAGRYHSPRALCTKQLAISHSCAMIPQTCIIVHSHHLLLQSTIPVRACSLNFSSSSLPPLLSAVLEKLHKTFNYWFNIEHWGNERKKVCARLLMLSKPKKKIQNSYNCTAILLGKCTHCITYGYAKKLHEFAARRAFFLLEKSLHSWSPPELPNVLRFVFQLGFKPAPQVLVAKSDKWSLAFNTGNLLHSELKVRFARTLRTTVCTMQHPPTGTILKGRPMRKVWKS